MVSKQDLLELGFVLGWEEHYECFFDINRNSIQARYFYQASGLFRDQTLIVEHPVYGWFDPCDAMNVSSKAQLQKLLKLHGF